MSRLCDLLVNEADAFTDTGQTSDARHARHAGPLLEVTRAPDLPTTATGGQSKRTLSQAFNADDIDGTLPESQRQHVDSSACGLVCHTLILDLWHITEHA